MTKFHTGCSALALLAAIAATPASAQETPAADAVAADTPDAGLAEITVTAQRREENLQRAAVAISVIGASDIRDAGITSPAQLTSLVPSLQVASGNGSYANFYVRGVGNFNGNALTDSAVAFHYDGVYIARPSSTTGFYYDLERVEVLKGPQGTLYGRNATGGAINVIPVKPGYDFGGYASVDIGNYNQIRVEGALNAPLSDKAAVRLSGIVARHGAYMKDGTDNQRDAGLRGQLRFDPADDLSITIGADYFRQRGTGAGGTLVVTGVDNRYGNFSPEASAVFTSVPHVLGGRTFDPLPAIQYQKNEYFGINSTISWKPDFGSFTIIPAFRRSDIEYASANVGFFIFQKERFDQTSIEARYASPETEPLRLLVGGYYFHERGKDPYNIINNQFGSANQLNQRYGTDASALFGRLTYDITPTFRATGGIRYTHEKKKYSGETLALVRTCLAGFLQCPNAVAFPNEPTVPPFAALPDGTVIPQFFPDGIGQFGTFIAQDKEATFNRVTWRAGLDWDVTPRNLLYAAYETGFKSGGFYATRDAGIYRPETIQAWTLGSKNRFLDNRIQLNLEAFYWKYRDQQVSHLGLDSAGTLVFPTENVGRSTVKGVEAEAQFLATPDTLLKADVQYLDSVYNSFVYLSPVAGGAPFTGCAVTPGATNFTIDCSGFRPPQSPKWSLNLAGEQTFHLQNGSKIQFDLRAHHQSRTLTSLEFLPDEYQKAYWTVDAQIALHGKAGWQLALYMNNIFDVTVKGQTFLTTYAAVPLASAILRPPRTFGARFTYDF